MNAQTRLFIGALSGALVGLGCWLLLVALLQDRDVPAGRSRPVGWGRRLPGGPREGRPSDAGMAGWGAEFVLPVAGGVLAGLILGVVVGVPVLGVLGGGAAWLTHDVRRGPSVDELNELGEAVATWCETVRQELDAGQPLKAAVVASCQLPPSALAGPLGRLRVRLDQEPLPAALAGFRAEVNHPLVGSIAAVLSLTYRRGAGDLARLMAEQVESTRHRVAVLRDLHAARARYRRSMVLLLGLFAVSVVGVLAVWPAMLAPYRTAWGQAVLIMIAGVVGLAVRTLLRLARPAVVPDFFGDAT
ncbi:hypothetical protein ThrDRAFT_03231 [Frankia casuarinae]|uniref:Type II secretion system protein n=1 Tax=Frankia casuarinae (strain DSM 45818 / CECT 9043 / HFP020203 / CcI3) TaxID=106370 RepID=Q2J7Q4_FRACC|nr:MULTISPECIES: hypothetical protein [Frankia]ABD12688.1 hypothetical protein Francci3_3331 [Frankia casuarinae]EYT91129.1 hypothetical protein ThrDRAFT_03231 [Frankia casuarinae]KDA41622.1 hypothetical protein BMG523Draft_03560 [Frankia sp. BMG5.23]TFE27411.1 hypothetical protein E0F15_16505 [Frankia sp. B2]